MIKSEEIKAACERLEEQKRQLDENIKRTIRAIVDEIPGRTISLTDCHAYACVEGAEHWMEVSVYGVRLRNRNLEVSLEYHIDDNGGKTACWDEHYTADDHDRHCSINWLSVLNSLSFCLGDGVGS